MQFIPPKLSHVKTHPPQTNRKPTVDARDFLADKGGVKFALPIDAVLPQVLDCLTQSGRVVLQAPPGAGKTTRTPLAILESGQCPGKILMLEPRRLAARAAAERMADTLGEKLGETVGYRIRGQSKIGPNTRIEVLTEGILTRMIQADPELPGVGAILFDEFHERSLAADLGLALAWELRETLREDLWLVVMSATLDAAPVAALLDDAPIVTSAGRSFPVELTYLPRPAPKDLPFEAQARSLILQAVADTEGGILVFLPGEAEIRRTKAALQDHLPKNCVLRPLLGNLPFAEQQLAIRPEARKNLRKIVLATAIAETSLTIQDVRVVVDCGRARRARYDPEKGLQRLVTERVSKAEATQRAGRAGRVAAGRCYRMWARAEEGAMPAFAPPEIAISDLAPLALELAQWGSGPEDLAFLTPPAPGPWAQAKALLGQLGALSDGRLTPHGAALAKLPLHPRLAQMLLQAGPRAAPLAALLSDRDILSTQNCDLTPALTALTRPTGNKEQAGPIRDHSALDRIKQEAKRLSRLAPKGTREIALSPAQCLALAYPERVAQRRPGPQPRYIMAGGKGAVLTRDDSLANARYLVISDLGNPHFSTGPDPKIRRALALSEAELREVFADQITWETLCHWSKRHRRVIANRSEMLGALSLTQEVWRDAPSEALAAAMVEGVQQMGLRLPKAARLLQARVAAAPPGQFPDLSDTALLEAAPEWLAPYLTGLTTEQDWKAFDPLPALEAYIGWAALRQLEKIAPAHFTTPLGRKITIDYSGDSPAIELRIQEIFGQTRHPMIGDHPLKVTLLSPAHRPIQVTTDIPGFWTGSYADVRKDMRAQYPKHPWPEDPTQADPTLRAKPRKR
ncbi:ATP-dependent helicase HrpB [Planktomarina temperata]|uniref:ATP-dependent helicase HrpB n=1 Tax=Planktomarina sp. TaxID=2024851 RepID=UPI002302EB41|nr:ATP-dependent helicase HrpB [Planktomarina temperata]MDA8966324.1 ATP-dependent helicase HrpB [Planktomarina temperata]MDB0073108.1 ATP-dependent helicase HrpB [Planktomarina temperata]